MLSRKQSVFDLQLQPNSDFFGYKIFLFCANNTDAALPMELPLTFNVFLLKILCKGFSFGKCLFTSLKNIFPTFVSTFNENGGLNHITFFCAFSSLRCHSQLFLYYKLICHKNHFFKRFWVYWYWITKNVFIRWIVWYSFGFWF